MAFNHVGNCDCSVGCCDCGPVSSYEAIDEAVRQHINSLIPKDLRMLISSGDLYEVPRKMYPIIGENEFIIGQIDPTLTVESAVAILFTFYGWLFENKYLRDDNGARYMRKLIDLLEDTGELQYGLGEPLLNTYIAPLYMKPAYSCL